MGSNLRSLLPIGIAIIALVASSLSRESTADELNGATTVVDVLHGELLYVMQHSDELEYKGRFQRLEPVVAELYDTPFMAEKSIGRHWKKIDEGERAQLRETFQRFTIANYAGRFNGYSGERFETLREEPSTHGTVFVHSQLVMEDGHAIQLNYRLRPAEGGWKIFDVYLNGTVSELTLRRSEYSSLLQREGFPALISALGERIEALAKATPAEP